MNRLIMFRMMRLKRPLYEGFDERKPFMPGIWECIGWHKDQDTGKESLTVRRVLTNSKRRFFA